MTENAELNQAVELLDANATDEGQSVHRFKKPVTVNGTTYTELTLDFDGLTGADMEAIESAVIADGSVIPQIREFSKAYLMHVVARAARVNINDVRAFPIKDVTSLTMRAQGFLMSSG